MGTSDGTTRLSISGVPSRVALRVAERREGHATLEQRLPFLAIGTEIADEDGRTGRIARVAVALERGVPKLVLELDYDVRPVRVRGDQTISYDQRASSPDLRPTVPEPLRPRRIELDPEGAPAEAAKRSRPLAVAFPLEHKRAAPVVPTSWLGRLFAWMGPRSS